MKTFYKPSGNTYYCRIIERDTGYVWNTSSEAVEDADTVSWANSIVTVTELTEKGQYPIILPDDLTTGKIYNVVLYQQSGDSPAYTDLIDDSYELRHGSIFGF